MVRIFVDFNSTMRDERERVYIGMQGSPYEDQRKLDGLREGMPVLLYDSEMEVQAVTELERDDNCWLALPDWSTRRDVLEEETPQPSDQVLSA